MPHLDTPYSRCRLGLARCDITPPVGIYHRMWGAATHERATGVHRPLTATAMTFQAADEPPTPETEQVVLAVDHCLLWDREMTGLLSAVSKKTGLPVHLFLVAFSHTHAAGLMDLERVKLPGGEMIPAYLDELADRLAAIVRQARQAVRPVTLTYGVGRCSMAGQRDFWDEETGQFVCGLNPTAAADDTVLVVRASGGDGSLVATIVNYACHPTTLAWENTLISPDFPGAMREGIEKATGVPCVFLQGASGDLGPREGFVGDVAVADRNGRQLGYAALAVLEAMPPANTRFQYTGPVISGATLGTWAHVPLNGEVLQAKSRWRLRRWTVDLPYRPGLPTVAETQQERAEWQEAEREAQAAGDAARARDARAMIERMDRRLTRIAALPQGPAFPLPITLLQIGDAFWLGVEGEHYQYLQRAVRERFPGVPIVVMTLANGSRCSYLPTADAYGKGIYQESIAVLAPGCLETLADTIQAEIRGWLG